MARIIQKDKTIQNVFRLEQVVLELGQLFERSWDLWIFAYWAWKQVTLWMVVRYVWDQHMVVWSEKASDHVLHISLALPSKIWDPDGAIWPSDHIHCIISSFLPWLSSLFALAWWKCSSSSFASASSSAGAKQWLRYLFQSPWWHQSPEKMGCDQLLSWTRSLCL